MTITIDSLIENKKKIADLIESFSSAIKREECSHKVLTLLHRISFYSENFFISEESFLKKYKIPSYEEHINEHKQFVMRMVQFQKRLEKGEKDICKDLFNYIKKWYDDHIMHTDKEIIEYIEKNGK